jgi:hypothetical protein
VASALAGGGGGPVADGLGARSGHAEPVATEGLAQRRPGGAQPLSEGEGALGLGPVGKEAAGLPAHPWLEQSLTIAGPIASAAYKTAVGGASAMLASP